MADSTALPPISHAYARTCELARATGVTRLDAVDGCWIIQVDDRWWLALNGHREPHPAASETGMSATEPYMVEPYGLVVEFNGWLFGLLDPFGGTTVYGEAANEDTFIAALDAAIVRAGAPRD